MDEHVKDIINAIPDLVVIFNSNGKIIDVSQNVLDFYNISDKNYIVGKDIFDFVVSEQQNELRDNFEELKIKGNFEQHEYKLLREDGSIFCGELDAKAIEGETEGERNFIIVIRDITPQKIILGELNNSKQMFQLVLDNIPQFIFWKDIDSKYLGCNKNFARVAGVEKPEGIVGKTDFDLAWKFEEAESFFEIERLVMESGIPEFHIIEPQLQAGGKQAWLDVNRIPLYDPEGKIIGLLGTYEDITERKNAEEKLKESEEKYRKIFENSPIAFMEQDYSETKRCIDHLRTSGIIDFEKFLDDNPEEVLKFMTKAKVIDVNKKALEVYKANNKENFILRMNQLSDNIDNNITDEVLLYNKKELLSLIEGETVYESELASKTFTEDMIYLYAKTSLVPGFENIWSKVIISLIDITEKKIADEKLKESERKYRNIVENSLDGISLTNEQGNIIEWNQGMEMITGFSQDEVLGRPVWEVQFPLVVKTDRTPEMKERLKTGVLSILEKEDLSLPIQIREQVIQDRSGSLKIVQTSSYLIKSDLGIMIGTIMRDISNLKKAEEIILEENKRLLELDKVRQELMTRISHELKTPLTSIYGVIQVLMDMDHKKLDENFYPLLEIGSRGTLRLKKLIENLLDSSRLDIKKIKLNLNKENLSIIIKNCIDELLYIAKSRKIILESEVPEEIYLKIDSLRFSQVIINIISNAIKNTPPKGLVFIRLTENQNNIEISVKDTGVGITDKEKKKLFQKFGKIERYGMGIDLDIEGAGLGLYISKEIVELHGGQILVESEGRNKGTNFIIRLLKKEK